MNIYIYIYMYLNEIYFSLNYDLIYMILDNLTILVLWYPANRSYSLISKLVLSWASRDYRVSRPSWWGIYISTKLVSVPMNNLHWLGIRASMNNPHWLGIKVKTESDCLKSYISNHSSNKNIFHSNTYIKSYI